MIPPVLLLLLYVVIFFFDNSICQEVKANPNNYDAWFDYLRLMESEAEPDAVREVYERAIANVPPAEEKRLWRRYIYLWINYALYEELIAKVNRRLMSFFNIVFIFVDSGV